MVNCWIVSSKAAVSRFVLNLEKLRPTIRARSKALILWKLSDWRTQRIILLRRRAFPTRSTSGEGEGSGPSYGENEDEMSEKGNKQQEITKAIHAGIVGAS